MAHELLGYLRERRGQMVALLERLALEESPSSEPNRQSRVLDLLWAPLAGCGYTVRRVGNHLYARPRERGRRRATPAGSLRHRLAGRDHEGDAGRVGRRARAGPGVYDMKAGLAQMVFALGAISALGLEPSVTPWSSSTRTRRWGPGSTRHIRRLARVVERAFVMEPSLGLAGKLKTARKGGGRFSVVVEGQAAHGPRPGGRRERHTGALVPYSRALRPQRSRPRHDRERGPDRRRPEPERRGAGVPPRWTCGSSPSKTRAACRRAYSPRAGDTRHEGADRGPHGPTTDGADAATTCSGGVRARWVRRSASSSRRRPPAGRRTATPPAPTRRRWTGSGRWETARMPPRVRLRGRDGREVGAVGNPDHGPR